MTPLYLLLIKIMLVHSLVQTCHFSNLQIKTLPQPSQSRGALCTGTTPPPPPNFFFLFISVNFSFGFNSLLLVWLVFNVQFLTKTEWWVIPLIWLPVVCWSISRSVLMGHKLPQIATLVILGIFIWTLMEYTLHRFLFHIKTKSYWFASLSLSWVPRIEFCSTALGFIIVSEFSALIL